MRHSRKLGGRAAAVYTLRPVDEPTTARQGWPAITVGLVVLILLSLAGDLAVAMLGIAVPGPIVGLAAYLALLALWPAFRSWTLTAARLLTRFLGALIVPAAVGLAAFAPFVAEVAPQLVLVIVVSTLVTGLTTALLYAGLRR